jgi:hypothetical protein
MPMLATDARSEWNESLLDDPRVQHFWDEERVAGLWLAERNVSEEGFAGVVWDAYLLFGPRASWESEPAPLAGAGAPVVDKADQLEEQLGTLIGI